MQKIFIVLAFWFYALPVLAADSLPSEMMVDGKPVDALCFGAVGGEPIERFFVRDCLPDAIVESRDVEDNGRSHMVTYKYKDDPEIMIGPVYAGYRYIGKKDSDVIVLVHWSGGGTGRFTTLMQMKREGDYFISIRGIAGGDRCNGGIIEASMNGQGQLVHSQYMTAYDVFALGADQNGSAFKTLHAYEDLDACAICCYAEAVMIDEEPSHIIFDEDSVYSELNEDKPYQACINKKIQDDRAQNKYSYTLAEWKDFIQDFETSCFDKRKE